MAGCWCGRAASIAFGSAALQARGACAVAFARGPGVTQALLCGEQYHAHLRAGRIQQVVAWIGQVLHQAERQRAV
ncbi:hypothetical protein XGA_1986 [Xanthomonas hortorum ATCC 19865]|nr:hypothetical protein XGA_1986 [Xanthomonas hortorum ATCC 19865]